MVLKKSKSNGSDGKSGRLRPPRLPITFRSVHELLPDLSERNVRTKTRKLSTGTTRDAIPFGRGTLYYMPGNHFDISEVK
jgi:hypothetical protein